MRLKDLIEDCPEEAGEIEITSLAVKSSQAQNGSMFFALNKKRRRVRNIRKRLLRFRCGSDKSE